MSTPEGLAVWRAIERIASVMQANYATELSAIAEYSLPLPAPVANDYFAHLSEPVPEQALKNASVAVQIYQDSDSSLLQTQTNTPSTMIETQMTVLGVQVVYRLRPSDTNNLIGKAPTVTDVMTARGYYYQAALISTLRKYACDGEFISDLVKLRDHAGVVAFDEEDQPIVGVATAVWEVMQHVEVER